MAYIQNLLLIFHIVSIMDEKINKEFSFFPNSTQNPRIYNVKIATQETYLLIPT